MYLLSLIYSTSHPLSETNSLLVKLKYNNLDKEDDTAVAIFATYGFIGLV